MCIRDSSKTLLHESIVEYIHALTHAGLDAGVYRVVEWLFLISGGLTAAYMTKLFVCIFLSPKARGQHAAPKPYWSAGTAAALTGGAGVLLALGVTPSVTMQPIAVWAAEFLHGDHLEETLHYFSLTNLKAVSYTHLDVYKRQADGSAVEPAAEPRPGHHRGRRGRRHHQHPIFPDAEENPRAEGDPR